MKDKLLKYMIAYQKMLRKNQALDFDDLIMETIHLFKRVPEVLNILSTSFSIYSC